MLLSTLYLTPETQQLMHYSWLQWVNERDAALSIQEPFPAVILWVKEQKKSPDAHFYIRRQSDVNVFFNVLATKSFDRCYFINTRWPQRGAATPQHMRDVPQFSQQHMYACMCVRVCVGVWHQYVRGVLSSCVRRRSSDGDQLKVAMLEWARDRRVAEPDERRARGGINLTTKCYPLLTAAVTSDRC